MAGILLEGRDVTDEHRAAHARKMAAEKRAEAMRRAEGESRTASTKLVDALALDGRVIADHIVDAGAHWSARILAGHHLRIIDLEGRQAVDFLCYDLSNPMIRYNAANTIKLNRSVYIGAGFKLYSDRAESLMTVVADTVASTIRSAAAAAPTPTTSATGSGARRTAATTSSPRSHRTGSSRATSRRTSTSSCSCPCAPTARPKSKRADRSPEITWTCEPTRMCSP
jgi:uncharacterized protein YcgI (DUF1989 family)